MEPIKMHCALPITTFNSPKTENNDLLSISLFEALGNIHEVFIRTLLNLNIICYSMLIKIYPTHDLQLSTFRSL